MIVTEKQQIYQHYLTVVEILQSDQRRVIVQAMFTYLPLGKTVKKQMKKIKNQGEKQINALKSMGKNLLNLMHLLKKKKKVYRLISIPS